MSCLSGGSKIQSWGEWKNTFYMQYVGAIRLVIEIIPVYRSFGREDRVNPPQVKFFSKNLVIVATNLRLILNNQKPLCDFNKTRSFLGKELKNCAKFDSPFWFNDFVRFSF